MDVIKRIDTIMETKGLTDYQLAKISCLSPSTISNMRIRNTIPSIATLEYICKAVNIPLAQFFIEENTALYPLTNDQKSFMDAFILLPKNIQETLAKLVSDFHTAQKQ